MISIALEIASILEQRGHTKINIYLLDTLLYDSSLLSITNAVPLHVLEQDYRVYAQQEGFEASYIEKVIAVIPIENILVRQEISAPLRYSQIFLFKALLEDVRIKTDYHHQTYEHELKLPFNNIEKVVTDKNIIKVIRLDTVNHYNILNEENLISQWLCSNFKDTVIAPISSVAE